MRFSIGGLAGILTGAVLMVVFTYTVPVLNVVAFTLMMIGFGGMFVGIGLDARETARIERHRECLASIAKMEPEVLPDLPEELRWV